MAITLMQQNGYMTMERISVWYVGMGNGELQYYQPQNTTVNNGIATIEVREEPAGLIDSWNNTSYYSSSKLQLEGYLILDMVK